MISITIILRSLGSMRTQCPRIGYLMDSVVEMTIGGLYTLGKDPPAAVVLPLGEAWFFSVIVGLDMCVQCRQAHQQIVTSSHAPRRAISGQTEAPHLLKLSSADRTVQSLKFDGRAPCNVLKHYFERTVTRKAY